MVCCDSDAIGVTNTLLYFLRPKGIAFFAVPNPYHRYGVAKLIPTLQQHFHVFLRPISHSSFAAQHHSSFDSEVLTEEIKSQLDAHQLYLIETLLEPSNQFLNDQLTHDLPEKEYFEWLLVIVIRRRTENRAKES